jgi:FkbM family methyltransferase
VADRTPDLSLHEALKRADALNRLSKHGEAVAVLEPYAVAETGQHYWLNFHLGRAYSGLGDPGRADKYFTAAAAARAYPYRTGALYEIVRLDISLGRFERACLLDDALAMPGDVEARDEAAGQKRFYYDRIHFLKALTALRGGDFAETNRELEIAYDFNRALDERSFAFPWLLELLREWEPPRERSNAAYLRQRLLRTDMTRGLSYRQALERTPRGAKALEIGAMDGVRFDALHPYLKQGRFEAVVVEPVAEMFELLSQTYADCPNVACVRAAIADRSGPLRLYRISSDDIVKHKLPEWIHGVTSAVKGPVLSYFADHVREETVRGLTFEDFAAEIRLAGFDVLQIDTEGYDWNVLKQIDLKKHGVSLTQIEIINLMPHDRLQVFSFLRDSGYLFDYEYGDVVAAAPAFYSDRLKS